MSDQIKRLETEVSVTPSGIGKTGSYSGSSYKTGHMAILTGRIVYTPSATGNYEIATIGISSAKQVEFTGINTSRGAVRSLYVSSNKIYCRVESADVGRDNDLQFSACFCTW